MDPDVKKETKQRLLLLRDAVVVHYLMQSEAATHQTLQRSSYSKWLQTKLSQEQSSDEEFMNRLLHGFSRFVETHLGTVALQAECIQKNLGEVLWRRVRWHVCSPP